ncbi:MAG: phage holin family protein [bacterium]|nr:phage holin family protein [bacterium]
MIKKIIRMYFINILALYLVSTYIGGFHLAKGWLSLLEVGAGFTIIHLLIRPILGFITGPLNFLTLGLIGLVIDAILLYGLTMFFPEVYITAWVFPGFFTANFSLEPMALSIIMVTILCAFIINLIRSVIISLCD